MHVMRVCSTKGMGMPLSQEPSGVAPRCLMLVLNNKHSPASAAECDGRTSVDPTCHWVLVCRIQAQRRSREANGGATYRSVLAAAVAFISKDNRVEAELQRQSPIQPCFLPTEPGEVACDHTHLLLQDWSFRVGAARWSRCESQHLLELYARSMLS